MADQTAQNAPTEHSLLDDLQGLSLGVFMCGMGVHFLTTAGLITGQTAGIAVILSYVTGYSFGLCFFAVNLPFYVFAWQRLGPAFTIKSLICVTLLSVVTDALPLAVRFEHLSPEVAAVSFGAMVGIGMIAMFRHNGSLGGVGVIALIVQDKTGFRAGWVQLIADAIIFSVALALFQWEIVAISLVGAVVLNLIIAINHRRDRYIAT
ncbi:MAG: YitT family protein [Pseudomonadota bacterium]